MQALILAAGLGTRLRPYTEKAAKPSLPFLNVPMLGYSLYLLEQIGLKNLVVNTHHAADSIQESLNRISKSSYKINYSHEPNILGSGGGLAQASQFFDKNQPVFLLNGDNVCLYTDPQILKKLYDFHLQSSSLATILCCPNEEVGKSFGGVFVEKTKSESGFEWAPVKTFSKKTVDGLQGFHFTGVILFSPEIYSLLPQGSSNILYDILATAIDNGKSVQAFIDPSLQWFETGDPRSYLEATRICLQSLNQNTSHSRYLDGLLKRFSPGWDNYKRENVFSSQPLADSVILSAGATGLVGRACQVSGGSRLTDFFVIGEGSKLAEASQLEAGVIFPHQQLNKGERLFSTIKA